MKNAKISARKELIIVGDRVLILPDSERVKSGSGLFLPQGIEEKEKVQTGLVVKTGPGYPLPDPNAISSEPWGQTQHEPKYLPLQVEEGDYAIFLRKSAVEIEYEGKKYLIVPQSAILLLVRNSIIDELIKNPDNSE